MNRTKLLLGTAGGLLFLAALWSVPSSSPKVAVARVAPAPSETLTAKDGSLRVRAKLSSPFVLTGTSKTFAEIELTGATAAAPKRLPVNLAVVIDRSGSMAGEKLGRAKDAARTLLRQLEPSDRLAVIHYGSEVESTPSEPRHPKAEPGCSDSSMKYMRTAAPTSAPRSKRRAG